MAANVRLGMGVGSIADEFDSRALEALLTRRADGGGSPEGRRAASPPDESGIDRETDRSPDDASTAESDSPPGDDASEAVSEADDEHRRVIERLRRGEALVDQAESARTEHDYATAVEAYERAREAFEAARDRAATIPNTKHLVVRETRGDAISGRLEAVERALSEVRAKREPYDLADAILTDVADQRAAARGELDAGEFDAARTIAIDGCETLALVERFADARSLDLANRIERLRDTLESTLEQADRRAKAPGALAVRPPAIVPRAPRLSMAPEDYDPQAVVGTSGTATVERAVVSVSDRERVVALKRFRPSAVDIDEAVATWEAVADHDHVASVVDRGVEPEPWIALEYMDGGRIDERAGRLPTDQALWTASAVADAVWHAHRQSVVHGRITPSNVLFRSVEDAWDVPRVTDWAVGRALRVGAGADEGTILAERPRTAAPEQLRGEAADERTDLFQLGVVLYELVTGERPFGADHRDRSPEAFGRPEPPSSVVAVPAALDDVLGRALAADPEDRYQRALFFRDDLRDLYRSY
ncbi:MAG: serine/threonine-protein kinase [Halococcoides sp.]